MPQKHAAKPKQNDASKTIGKAIKLHRQGKLAEAEKIYLGVLATEPNNFDALHMLGVIRLSQGKTHEAFDLISRALAINGASWRALYNYGRVLSALGRYEEAVVRLELALAIEPGQADVLFACGSALHKLNRLEDALRNYDKVIAIKTNPVGALYNRGNVLLELKRYEDALASFDKVLAIKPDYVEAHDNRGIALYQLKRYEHALASHDRALAIDHNYAEAHNNRGNTLRELDRHEEALASFEKALAIRPDFVLALYNHGNVLRHREMHAEALLSYDKALAIKPDYVEAMNNRGNVLRDLNRHEEALVAYDQALAINPSYAEAHNNRGNELRTLNRFQDSMACYDKALALKPDFAQAHHNRGNVLHDLHHYKEALACFDQAQAIKPDFADTHADRGATLRELGRYDEAMASFERALEIEPDHLRATGGLATCALAICDWARTAMLSHEVEVHQAEGKSAIGPFTFLHYSNSPAAQLRCAQNFVERDLHQPPSPIWRGEIYHHDKIRVAYASADFHNHNTGYLMAELFELHDRSRFEVIGISFGRDDGSDMRARLVKAFDQFHDIRTQSDREAAELLRGLETDIVVDLKGYTQHCRPGILAHRPAPVHVNYLGFQGTMGAEFVDYIIGDEIALPFHLQPFFTENIVHLPVCHQVNDSTRAIPPGAPARGEVGLPQEGFVFCCFNNNNKLTPLMFDIWMRLLGAVDGSVLWLMEENALASANLRREASARGIDPARLVFASHAPIEDHLRRHRLADVFLDTLPHNAHTSASRALWAGLPILTCAGGTFAGRISASLLQAAGLPELVTDSLEDYEALAKALAGDPSRLQRFKRHLEQHRHTCSLFDTDRFRRHIEAAFTTMWEQYQRGESPRSFTVTPV